jgi:hypothetical protein
MIHDAAPEAATTAVLEPDAACAALPKLNFSSPSCSSMASRIALRRQDSARRRENALLSPRENALLSSRSSLRDEISPRFSPRDDDVVALQQPTVSPSQTDASASDSQPAHLPLSSARQQALVTPNSAELPNIFLSARVDNAEMLERVLASDLSLANFQTPTGDTPLIAAVSRLSGGRKCALLLLRHGADPNLTNFNGASALMWAAHLCNSPCVELLLQKGARADLRATAGPWITDTALMLARKNVDNKRCVKLIEAAEKKHAAGPPPTPPPNPSISPSESRAMLESPPLERQESPFDDGMALERAEEEEDLMREVAAKDAALQQADAEQARLQLKLTEMEAQMREEKEDLARKHEKELTRAHRKGELDTAIRMRAKDELRRKGEQQLPPTWSSVKDEITAELVDVAAGSSERQEVEDAFQKSLGGRGIAVLNVQRVQHASLWRQYRLKLQSVIQREGTGSEQRYMRRWLFHGTDEDTVPKITQNGFNRSFCGKNATAYGKGGASKSSQHKCANIQHDDAPCEHRLVGNLTLVPVPQPLPAPPFVFSPPVVTQSTLHVTQSIQPALHIRGQTPTASSACSLARSPLANTARESWTQSHRPPTSVPSCSTRQSTTSSTQRYLSRTTTRRRTPII